MKNKYIDLIQQAFEVPNDEFTVEDGNLNWFGIPLMDVIKQYGTPLRIAYLPKIGQNIQRARRAFNVAMAKVDYQGDYNYCYCTKSSHFSFVMEEVLKHNVHIETSSAFDMNILENLYENGFLKPDTYILCNGFKRPQYVENIENLVDLGFKNIIPILDNKFELDLFNITSKRKFNIGIRIAAEEEPKFDFYTSRLGIRYNDIIPYCEKKIKPNKNVSLKMLHFFINTGIRDTAYYWNELNKVVNLYCELKHIFPSLDSLNIGGGFPIQAHLDFDYDYEYMAEEIVAQIKKTCKNNGVEDPHIFTEFGSYTVGESGAMLYSIINQKQQNDRELWNMIDSSFMTTLPTLGLSTSDMYSSPSTIGIKSTNVSIWAGLPATAKTSTTLRLTRMPSLCPRLPMERSNMWDFSTWEPIRRVWAASAAYNTASYQVPNS